MTRTRTIAILLLAGVYFAAAYGNSLRVMMPSVGSGSQTVHREAGQSKDLPRPNWTPRRHLPLVKLPSFDQVVATPPAPMYSSDCSEPHPLLQVDLDRKEQFRFPSCSRAPPIR